MIIYHIIGICDETYNIFYFLYIFNGLLLVDTFSLGFKCGFYTFTYIFNNNELSITRTDESSGWGQDLIGYL